MSSGDIIPLSGALVVLLFFSAFFSCAETAFFSLSRVQLSQLRRARGVGARWLVRLLKDPRDTLIGTLMGNELINCAFAVVVAQIMNVLIHDPVLAAIMAVACATPVVVVFGEVVPKNFAVGFAPRISPVLAIPMTLLLWCTTPVRWVLVVIADAGVRLFGGDPRQVRALIFEEEFRQIVDLSGDSGALSDSERELIHGVFAVSDLTVDTIMTPAATAFRLSVRWPYEKILGEVRSAQFARVPVYRDHPDQIVGLLYVRDLAQLPPPASADAAVAAIESIIRPALFITPHTQVEQILREFQRTKVHMAVVRDESVNMVGLITMHDVLDVLIGERHPQKGQP